jgi:signal transduction histidine kinase/DNA-binding response OmpR family regulator
MPDPSPIPILIVDDRRENLAALDGLLQDMELPLEVVQALSGNEALRATLKQDFALVLLDVQMPDMDGFETAALMRSNPKTSQVPIIFVTAGMKAVTHQFQGYLSGAVDYLAKPIEPAFLRGKVKVFCQLYQQRKSLEQLERRQDALVKERTRELREARANLTALIGSTSDLIWSVDRDYRLLTFNQPLADHFQRNYGTRAEIGRGSADLLPADKAAVWPGLYDRALREGPYQLELTLPDGRLLEMAFNPITEGEAVTGCSVFGKDITERRRAEATLRESEARNRHFVDNAPLGIFRCTLDGRFLYSNLGILNQFECQQRDQFDPHYPTLGSSWVEPGAYDGFRQRLAADRQVLGFEASARLRSGTVKRLLLYAFLDASEQVIDGFSVDATELRQAEAERAKVLEQLHQSQKMDALGQLAGGVAHDFNNLLGGIIGATELILAPDAELAPAKRDGYLNMILAAGNRAADLTRKLLAFSRIGPKEDRNVDVLRSLRDTVEILQRTLDKGIAIELENQAGHAVVLGDDSMLQNVFMNMGINASHAMPGGGRLTFTLRNLYLDEFFCASSPYDLVPGTFLEIEVRDSGCGMTPEVQKRIFEPFFTTKAPGQGTGLGLAAAYGTIRDHHGAITVYSEVGVGTAFHLYLPLSAEPAGSAGAEGTIVSGSGTILLVDDEELIRVTTQARLENLGYQVLVACDGQEAVTLFRARHREIRLVILDMIMPTMGGKEAFRQFQSIDDRIPVLLSSGFPKEEDLAEMRRDGLRGFIRKPFRLSELSRTVAEAIRS